MPKSQKLCINYLLHYNLLYKFFQNIDFPYVQRFFLIILNCLPHVKELDQKLYQKVLDYFRLSNIFLDMSKIILNGEDAFPNEKLGVNYKPEGITSIIDLPQNRCSISCYKRDRSVSVEAANNASTPKLVEETKGFELDIDRIKEYITSPQKVDANELMKNNSQILSESHPNWKKYPSLVEKNYYQPNTASKVAVNNPTSTSIPSKNGSQSDIPSSQQNIKNSDRQGNASTESVPNAKDTKKLLINVPVTAIKNGSSREVANTKERKP